MTLWRIYRVDRTPAHDPDPATYAYQVILRDKDTGGQAVEQIAVPRSDALSPNDLGLRFCDHFDVTYTPNDFGCGSPITP